MTSELSDVLDDAWKLLGQGVASRKHGFHHAAVATVGANRMPRIRTVILRAADRASNTVCFHTDKRSKKCEDLRANSNLAMVLYDEPSKTQVRLEGVATIHESGDLAEQSWGGAQAMSKICYGINPEPGRTIASPDAFTMPAPQADAEAGHSNFVVVEVKVNTLQWLYLKHGGQRCAVFDLVAGTQVWTVPS